MQHISGRLEALFEAGAFASPVAQEIQACPADLVVAFYDDLSQTG
jgi:hypothetical protein